MQKDKIRVSKIDAARRQLDCAIELWFLDRDAVSIHTLAAAAYQIVHDINKRQDNEHLLLYDSVVVKEEYRKLWVSLIRKPGNFFKHADSDPHGTIEFSPFVSVGFMLFSVLGLGLLGERASDYTAALSVWLSVHDSELVTDKYRKSILDQLNDLAHVKQLPKAEFLKAFLQGQEQRRTKRI